MSTEAAQIHGTPGLHVNRFSPTPRNAVSPNGRAGDPYKAEQRLSLAQMCRAMSEDVVLLLHDIVKGEHPDATVSDQLKAAQLVLDRGFGRAVSVVEMTVTEAPKTVRQLSREELVRLANGEVLSLPVTIEGECVTPVNAEGNQECL
jgi:hypothetical protein